jgi:hypothetical protein
MLGIGCELNSHPRQSISRPNEINVLRAERDRNEVRGLLHRIGAIVFGHT